MMTGNMLIGKKNDIRNCPKKTKSNVEVRENEVNTVKLCYSGLKPEHQISKCTFKITCGINGYKRPHNKFHYEDKSENNSNMIEMIFN